MANENTVERSETARRSRTRSFVLPVELTKECDGRWSADVSPFPGCATWGRTWQEALRHAKEAAEGYVVVMLEAGRSVPSMTKVPEGPVIIAEV